MLKSIIISIYAIAFAPFFYRVFTLKKKVCGGLPPGLYVNTFVCCNLTTTLTQNRFMKKRYLLPVLLCLSVASYAQMPFSTVAPPRGVLNEKEKAEVNRNKNEINLLTTENNGFSGISTLTAAQKETINANKRKVDSLCKVNRDIRDSSVSRELNDIGKPDFLDHMNSNITSLQNGKKMFPTLNGELINYKLSLWTSSCKTSKGDTVARRHYLPISLFTKISGNYSDSAAGPSDDATSYFGAPLTLRFAPAFELFPNRLNENRLFVGLNTDLRLLTIGDTIKNKLQTTWGVYGSAGISYMGKGYAEDPTDAAHRYDGVWSFTAMLYFFKSGGEYNKAIFGNYEKKTLTGVELLLRFKTSKKENAKFNFLIGASNCFTKGAANTGSWQFRLGVGS